MSRLALLSLLLMSVPATVRAQSTAAAAGLTAEYYHLDAVGSVRVVTNQSQAPVRRHDYLPFGEEWNPQSGSNDTLRFTAKERDGETGLDYFGARYFASGAGRFTSVDPFLDQSAALTNPQRWNRYAYGGNSPLRNVDPDGRDWKDLFSGFAEGIGSAAAGLAMFPYALVTNPRAVASSLKADARLLVNGVANPGDVLDAYVGLAASNNDADQRALAHAVGEGTFGAALLTARFARAPVVDKWSRSPKSLMDQMVLEGARKGKGIRLIENLGDPRFKGMEKWSYGETSAQGLRSEVHYVRDPKTGSLSDFKFTHHVQKYR